MRERFHQLFLGLSLLCACLYLEPAAAQGTNNSAVVLTNAAQVRALSPAEAAKKIPVHLRGTVLELDSRGRHFSLVDDTAGIYAECLANLLRGVSRGDLIEMEGVTDPGKFAPFIDAVRVRKIGKGTIPEPLHPSSEDILSGQMDAQWIEISGVVRRISNDILELSLENGGGRVFAQAPGQKVAVDSKIRVRGICYYQFNKTRQAIRPYLSISPGERVVVEEPAVTNLDSLPLRSIGDLMQFNPSVALAHRVRVRGIVIQSQDGFWIHDSGRGIHVLSDDAGDIKVGEEVEVFGFVKRGDYGPMLEDVVFRKTPRKLPVVPVIRLNKASEALDHDSDLIQCDASIVEQWSTSDGLRLKLADGETEFPAILPLQDHNAHPPHWRTGTRVQITGVCTVIFRPKPTRVGTVEPQFFQLLLRSPADVVVLELPSWWDAEHVAWVTGGVAVLLLLAVGIVIWIGRRRLRQEALQRMKSEAEFAAVLNERNRMARELHDTLAQGLGTISLQLELAKRQVPTESIAQPTLEEARAQTRASLNEVRGAIWNMRSQVLETGDLASALQSVLHSLVNRDHVKSELRVVGEPRRFAPVVENDVLRIGQEAIANAVKHGHATQIEVTLQFGNEAFELTVADNGQGFDPMHPPASEGGFGLVAMRERAAEINGKLTVTSESGKGCTIQLTLPISRS